MKTTDLIERLSGTPVGARSTRATIAFGLGSGIVVSAAIMLAWLGLRPDLAAAVATPMFWMKLVYATALALIAFPLVRKLSLPTGTLARSSWLLVVPVAIVAAVALGRLIAADPQVRMHLIMGSSSQVCPWRIFALSMPILAGLLLSLRTLAPTRLVLAGMACGILAGAWGTFVYAFHCDESAAPFVAVWYTLGMAAVGLAGGIVGRPTLRW